MKVENYGQFKLVTMEKNIEMHLNSQREREKHEEDHRKEREEETLINKPNKRHSILNNLTGLKGFNK